MPDDSKDRLHPVIRYDIAAIEQTTLMLIIYTAKDDAQLRAATADDSKANLINLALPPEQALDLAESLTRAARRILSQTTPKRSDLH